MKKIEFYIQDFELLGLYYFNLGVIDTIGAGDTFNATVVACLSQGKNLAQSLDIGCKVAGAKVGQIGYDGLKEVFYS